MNDTINASHVYCILNTETGRRYVGSTTRIRNRRRQHLSDLRKHKHPSRLMQEDYDSFGEHSFVFFELEEVLTFSLEELHAVEQRWINKYNPEYNTVMNVKKYFPTFSAESREKSRQAKLGRKQSQEEKDKRAQSIREFWARPENKGKKIISPEQKSHLSKINTGKNNPNWGKSRSQESKDRARRSLTKLVYWFLSPKGEEMPVTTGLVQGAVEELGIPYWAARKLYIGNKKEYKGWKFLRTEPK